MLCHVMYRSPIFGFFLCLLTSVPVGAETPPDLYEVQPGDSLSLIASRADVDLPTLMSLNSLEDADLISVGATLKLREPAPPQRSTYRVQSGDTLSEIAERFGLGVDRLIAMNELSEPDRLAVGAELVVPGEAASIPTPAPTALPAPSPTSAPTSTPTPSPTPAQTATTSATAAPRITATPLPTSPPRPTPIIGPISAAPISPAGAPASVQNALKHLGAPYVLGGTTPAGFDCSGFVFYVQGLSGKPVSRDLNEQYAAGPHPTDQLRPGDLLFFQDTYMLGLSHNGIYLGNGQFINAVDESRGVAISTLTEPYWLQHWYGATRLT
jgi:peptidoglycan DL-endopeptidase LytE